MKLTKARLDYWVNAHMIHEGGFKNVIKNRTLGWAPVINRNCVFSIPEKDDETNDDCDYDPKLFQILSHKPIFTVTMNHSKFENLQHRLKLLKTVKKRKINTVYSISDEDKMDTK